MLLLNLALLLSACQPEDRASVNHDLSRADVNTLSNLAGSWDSGEVVALVRHTERCDRSPDACAEGTTGITESGEAAARELGAGFRALSLDSAMFYTSPEKRAVQTAEAAFGNGIETRDWLRICRYAVTPSLLANKAPEVNLVLVTHSTCMEQFDTPTNSASKDLDYMNPDTYGVVVFLRLDFVTKEVSLLGYLKSADWATFLTRLARDAA